MCLDYRISGLGKLKGKTRVAYKYFDVRGGRLFAWMQGNQTKAYPKGVWLDEEDYHDDSEIDDRISICYRYSNQSYPKGFHAYQKKPRDIAYKVQLKDFTAIGRQTGKVVYVARKMKIIERV